MKKAYLTQGAMFVLLLVSSSTGVLAARSATPTPSASTSPQATAQARLLEGKLKACQAKEAAIQKRSDQMAKMAINMQDKFTAIAARVKTYYTGTVLPSGKTVSNYDTLVAAIATKQAAVGTALAKAQSDVTAFSCTSDDPKTQLTQYRTDMQAVKSALKEFRTSIKDLIVAVHSVTGSTQSSASPSASTSPSSSASPAATTTTSPTATP